MKRYITKIRITFITTGISLLLASCSLDETLYGVATTDGFVKTEADANFVVNGVYGTLQEWNCFKSSTAGLILYSGDDFASNAVYSNTAGVWINRSFTSSDPYVRNTWNSFFQCINRANSAIEAIGPVTTIRPEVRAKINGEMTFLRGVTYFNLVRLFGGVPISSQATNPSVSFYKQRQPVDSVYKQIFSDLKNANQKCMPFSKQSSSEFGRATKGAAQGMLALAYLTYANYCDLHNKVADAQINYEFAKEWADSVILSNEYALTANYADLFDVTKEKAAYKEVIYGIQFTRDNLASGAASKGSEFAGNFQPQERWNICGNLTTKSYTNNGITTTYIPHNGNGTVFFQPWFVEQYFTGDYVGDYRSEVSFLTAWDGYTVYSPLLAKTYLTFPRIPATPAPANLVQPIYTYLDKYKDPNGLDARNNENDLFILRLAEIYLIKAEALNELGRTTEAYIPFNVLRARARNANGTARSTPADLAPGLDKDNFRMAVFNERGLELVGEGQRFFDLVRMRYMGTTKTMFQWRLDTFYPTMASTMKVMPSWDGTSKTWKGGRVYIFNVKDWNERYLLYPIPSNETDANPDFANPAAGLQKNNPGW